MKSLYVELTNRLTSVFRRFDREPGLLDILIYMGLYPCWRELVAGPIALVVFRFLFPWVLCAAYWRGSISATTETVFGKPRFYLGKSCLRDLFILLSLSAVFRVLVALVFFHADPNRVLVRDFVGDCILAPLSEDPVFFGFMMNALLKHFDGKAVKSTIVIVLLWVSFHILVPWLNLLVGILGLINAICYIRFRSVGCCMLVHFTWNFVGYVLSIAASKCN